MHYRGILLTADSVCNRLGILTRSIHRSSDFYQGLGGIFLYSSEKQTGPLKKYFLGERKLRHLDHSFEREHKKYGDLAYSLFVMTSYMKYYQM